MKRIFALMLVLVLLLSGCGPAIQPNPTNPTRPIVPTNPSEPTNPGEPSTPTNPEDPTEPGDPTEPTNPPAPIDPSAHKDADDNGYCDDCGILLLIYVDLYSVNDLHGKFVDGENHPGVDELTTYLKNARKTDDYAILLSAGDMWQGGAESNMTKGNIITDWMNELDFAAMTIGNHEYDWGSEFIRNNRAIAQFPFLAINIYDRATDKRVDYCDASVVVEVGGLQIGIIGAMGNHYSSIAVDKCQDVYFKTGSELTNLVKAESTRLQNEGADFIVYVIHSDQSDYDSSLSSGGYVDLVFEGHTHQGYTTQDSYGVYHLQNRGDNQDGISHVEVAINSVTNSFSVEEAGQISKSKYQSLADDPIVETLLQKYDDILSNAYEVLGYNRTYRSSTALGNIVAKLYYEAGVEKWGDKYNIVLGGGSLNTRSPYNLQVGDVTYADLQALFTFDNDIMLCAIKGKELKSRFFNNSDYRIAYGEYGQSVKNSIDVNATYYVVVDSWSGLYAPNKMTVVEYYDAGVFARDLLADYVRAGGLA
ncbi:MAG: hypothetical protein E7461_04235 [Ruminococcaceae bacterium]|nr:hypothetical protein [Oscillospiraceae bacterium]